jgi:MFS family permease
MTADYLREKTLFVPSPKNFYLMAVGQVVTVLGSSLLRFALSLHVLDVTGSETVFAALYAVSNIPLLLAPVGGAISDRFNRQRLMVLYDFTCCAVALAFLFIMTSGHATVFVIGIIMTLLGVIGAMETPNGTACIPLLVEERKLESANGIVQAVQSLSGVAAPVLGGVLYGVLGVRALVAVSGAAFFLAAVMEMFIKIPFSKQAQSRHIIPAIAGDMKEGFSFVVKQPLILKSMIIAALLNLLLTPYIVVGGQIILRITMKSGSAVYGIGMAIINLASIFGALSIGLFSPKMSMKKLYRQCLAIALLFLPMAAAVTPFLLDFGFYPSFILFLVCMVPVAMVMTIASIFVITRVQKNTPNEHLGKVMAIIMAAAQCAAPPGQILYGVLFERFSAAVYVPTLFVSIVMFALAGLSRRMLRNEV